MFGSGSSVSSMTSIELLRAIHHPTRRRIMEYVRIHGPSQVSELAAALGEQVGSISHHLRMLERVRAVERAPELAIDGRTSWWRTGPRSSFSWSVDDFVDNPADRMVAKTAEKLNLEFHLGKLTAWKREADRAHPDWRAAAFSSDTSALATPAELARLKDALQETVLAWRDSIDTDDGVQRSPVFIFAHGFPTRP